MQAIANTLVTILRGVTTDGYGDEQDVDTPIATGIPASLIEQSRRVTTRDDPTPRIVRYTVVRVPAGTDVTDQDRLLDERTGAKYVIDADSFMANPAMAADIRLDARRTT